MKIENMIFDDEFNVKIMDFGHSQIGQDKQSKISTFDCGTLVYLSPQQVQLEEFNGFEADLYATMFSLFIMVAGYYPYKSATKKDGLFKAL